MLLLGPRQTGKSTLIRMLSPDFEINLANEEVFVRFLRDPSLLNKSIQSHKKIFIDEVQRIPSILNLDTLILYPIEPFAKSKRRRLIQHPRYYFFDVGALNCCLENFTASPDRIANLFEDLFLQIHLASPLVF